MRPLFLDRDGVLNVNKSPCIRHRDEFDIFPYVPECLERLHRAGFEFFVASNQQGVTTGLTSPEELEAMTEMLQDSLRPRGFEIRHVYYALGLKDTNDPLRKPRPGMFLKAAEEYGVNLAEATMIGDHEKDIVAASRAGVRPLLVLSGMTQTARETQEWPIRPHKIFPTLVEATDWLLSE